MGGFEKPILKGVKIKKKKGKEKELCEHLSNLVLQASPLYS